jgi:hypothetical protein
LFVCLGDPAEYCDSKEKETENGKEKDQKGITNSIK